MTDFGFFGERIQQRHSLEQRNEEPPITVDTIEATQL